MDDYEKWLRRDGGDRGKRMLAILKLLAFFDRPAAQHCLKAIYDGEPIDGLTEPLTGVGEQEWNAAEEELVRLGLVVRSERESDLDVHAVVRAHFATKLRNRTEAWRKGHGRLYEHLFSRTDSFPDTVEGLQPLYQAIFHGCQAGLYKDAWEDVYLGHIMGVDEKRKTWGNIANSNLLALRCFFEEPWKTMWPEIDSRTQANLRAETAFYLRATGRLEEALELWNVGLEHFAANGPLADAARVASNRSELRLARGELGAAKDDAWLSVDLADRSGEAQLQLLNRVTLADVLHQHGDRGESQRIFDDVRGMSPARKDPFPLWSVQGYKYYDLFLANAEREAWELWQNPTAVKPDSESAARCDEVIEHTGQPPLEISLLGTVAYHLSLAGGFVPRIAAIAPPVGCAIPACCGCAGSGSLPPAPGQSRRLCTSVRPRGILVTYDVDVCLAAVSSRRRQKSKAILDLAHKREHGRLSVCLKPTRNYFAASAVSKRQGVESRRGAHRAS